MEKVLSTVKSVAACLLLFGITFGFGYVIGQRSSELEAVPVEDSQVQAVDLKLPMEQEKRVVTVQDVEAKLVEIGELSTYSGRYTITYGKSEMRYWLEDIPIPGTENDITITCDGIVKVGYNMEDIAVRVEENSIFVAIPEAELNDNYVILDSVKCAETNSVFNPIEFSQYQDLVTSIEQMGLEKVESEGIYANAEEHLKVLIEAFLSGFTEYEIIYM